MQKSPCVNCFAGLAVEARMQIYKFLKNNKEATVMQLVSLVGLTQPTVSYHLKEMKELGLLNRTKRGKEVLYSVNPHCTTFDIPCVLSGIKFHES